MKTYFGGKTVQIKISHNGLSARIGSIALSKYRKGWKRAVGFELEIFYNGIYYIQDLSKL